MFLRPLQKNRPTFQSIKKIRKSINSIGSGKWAIYYITKEGARIKGKKNLGPHINHLKNVTEENFTFQPIKLSIKDPLNKYQSIRQAGPSRRSTSRAIPQGSYQSALGDDSAQSAGEHVILQDSIDSKQLTETGVHNGTLSYKTPWQIEYAIRPGNHISTRERERYPGLWLLRQRRLETGSQTRTTTT